MEKAYKKRAPVERGSSERVSSERNSADKVSTERNTIIVKNYDYTVFFSVSILVLFGLVMIFSASFYRANLLHGNMYFFVMRQGLFALIGFSGLMFMSSFNYRYLKNFAWLIYGIAVVGLIAVLLWGETINGARRWITVPIFGSFQPSELAKLGVTLVLARMISAEPSMFKSLYGFIRCGIVVAIPVVLIGIGRNLSTMLIIISMASAIIFIASPYFWRYIVAAIGGAAGLVFYLVNAEGFRAARIHAWLDPFSDPLGVGFQTIQALFAVASGGLFGLGLGRGRQKLGYIPEAFNDIIFAVIAEELGFIGVTFLLFLFSILISRGIKIAMNATELFGSLVATGIIVQIAVQTIMNVAVVTNSIPNTGVPLPFISYGGTALVVALGSMGILLNISRYSRHSRR